MAARAAHHPSALLTYVFARTPRELRAGYEFFENSEIAPAAIRKAHQQASAERCVGHSFVFLAVDGSSLSYQNAEGTGSVGTRRDGSQGIKTMLGLAIDIDGVPLGLLGQCLWTRGKKPKKHHHTRTIKQKETKYWHDVIEQSQEVIDECAPGVVLWPQLDREGDSWSLLLEAVRASPTRWTTVRGRTNRTLVRDRDAQDETEPGGKLDDALQRQPVMASYELAVSAGPYRAARTARMNVRWVEVTLKLTERPSNATHKAPVFALLVEEEGTTPKGETPLRWLLLTTYPIETERDAWLVLYGYSLRWRIEQLHAALKDRGCQIEDSQLQDASNIERWAAVMFPVAVRLVRLVYMGRVQPDRPATDELTPQECEALALEFDLDSSELAHLTIGDAVHMLGKLGGHVGNPEKRPIGFKVLARGLKDLRPIVRLVVRRQRPVDLKPPD